VRVSGIRPIRFRKKLKLSCGFGHFDGMRSRNGVQLATSPAQSKSGLSGVIDIAFASNFERYEVIIRSARTLIKRQYLE
jgi:hypothetical protein